MACDSLICLFYIFQLFQSSSLSLYYFNEQLPELQRQSQNLAQVHTIVELVVVSGLALITSGLCNPCLNCSGDRGATSSAVLERNILDIIQFDVMMFQL